MLVLFLSLFFSSISVKCQTKTHNTTQSKTQLRKSLLQVNDLLADIVGKIDKERKLLSQINLNFYNDDRDGFMDYSLRDVWWTTTNLRAQSKATQPNNLTTAATKSSGLRSKNLLSQKQTIKKSFNKITKSLLRDNRFSETMLRENVSEPKISDIVANWAKMNKKDDTTGPTRTPNPRNVTTISTKTILSNITVTTVEQTTTTPTIAKTVIATDVSLPSGAPPVIGYHPAMVGNNANMPSLNKLMEQYHYGYFTAFMLKYSELITTADNKTATDVVETSKLTFSRKIEQDKTRHDVGNFLQSIEPVFESFNNIPTLKFINQTKVFHESLKQNKSVLLSPKFNEILDYYDTLVTQEQGDALFKSLANLNKTIEAQPERTVESCAVIFNAMLAPLEGNMDAQKRLSSLIHDAVLEDNLHLQNESTSANTQQHSNFSTDLPSRRMGMHSYKKLMRHLHHRHPTLFEKFKSHYKHRTKHKHEGHRRHHHYKHRKKSHQISDQSSEPTTKKPTRKNIDKYKKNSSEGEAYYREPVPKVRKVIKKNNKMQPTVTKKPSIVPNKIYSEYFKLLAKKLFEKKLKAKKRFKVTNFRRFVIDSSESRKSADLQNSLDKSAVHKIRAPSSYSDEEDYIRSNLYDALRHGNRSFVEFRALDNDNQTVGDLSSGPDDEWLIKKNIYKVFGNSYTN